MYQDSQMHVGPTTLFLMTFQNTFFSYFTLIYRLLPPQNMCLLFVNEKVVIF